MYEGRVKGWYAFYGELHCYEFFRDDYGSIGFGSTLCGKPLPVEYLVLTEETPVCVACYRLDLMRELSQ